MHSLRHIAFWSARYLYICSATIIDSFLLDRDSPGLLPLTLLVVLAYEMLYTYVVAYSLFPGFFLKKKYFSFFAITAVYTLLIQYLMAKTDQYANNWPPSAEPVTFLFIWSSFWAYIGYGPPAVCAMFLVIRMLRLYYKKIEEKEVLLRENANAESQLLKARVHPHFLFNTLNNIYSYTYDRPADAASLAESLSGTMRYMIRDCEASLVPLEKELKMITDYIQLEKVRYGHRLSLTSTIQGSPDNKLIAPLLMIPFIENSFKHGASQMMEDPWIKMHIFIDSAMLQMEVSNNKPLYPMPPQQKRGIGLKTVRKRLELLYPGNHHLEIDAAQGTYKTTIRIPLQSSGYVN
jgi:hypothetical protein